MSDLHSVLLADGDKGALIESLAKAAGIEIPAQYLAEVSTHLVIAARMAQSVFAAPVDPAAQHAAVYVPALIPTQGRVR